MRLFLLGATGNSGRRILRFALDRGHEVTVLVRDTSKLLALIGTSVPERLKVVPGDLGNASQITAAMTGHEVVINAAGYVSHGEAFTRLVQIAIDAASATLGEGGRFWQFGGAAVLDIPSAGIKGVDLPMVPKVYEAHRTNLIALERSRLVNAVSRPDDRGARRQADAGFARLRGSMADGASGLHAFDAASDA